MAGSSSGILHPLFLTIPQPNITLIHHLMSWGEKSCVLLSFCAVEEIVGFYFLLILDSYSPVWVADLEAMADMAKSM